MVNILLYGSLLLVPILSLAMANGSRGCGRQYALALMTIIGSVVDTIDCQLRSAGRLGLLAFGFVGAVLVLFFFVPAGSGPWVQFAGSALSILASATLGLAAGIAINAAIILAKVSKRDTIEAQLVMKQRARRRLVKFLSVLALVVLVGLGTAIPAHAGYQAWVWAIDVTDSVDPAQRNAAIAAMVESALETARRLQTDRIVVVKVGNEDFLSDMTWVAVPPSTTFENCQNVTPPFRVSKSWIGISPITLIDAKGAAVSACLARQKEERANLAEEEARFLEQLRQATAVVPRADVTTRIIPLLQTLLRRPYVGAVDLVTDLQDRSGTPPDRLEIPTGTPVTIVVTRPNPKRSAPTLRDVLESAEQWVGVKGVTVISVAEYPGYVHLAKAR